MAAAGIYYSKEGVEAVAQHYDVHHPKVTKAQKIALAVTTFFLIVAVILYAANVAGLQRGMAGIAMVSTLAGLLALQIVLLIGRLWGHVSVETVVRDLPQVVVENQLQLAQDLAQVRQEKEERDNRIAQQARVIAEKGREIEGLDALLASATDELIALRAENKRLAIYAPPPSYELGEELADAPGEVPDGCLPPYKVENHAGVEGELLADALGNGEGRRQVGLAPLATATVARRNTKSQS